MPDNSSQNPRPDQPAQHDLVLLDSILNTVPCELVVRDADSRIIFANRAFAVTYQSSPEHLIGRRDADNWAEFGRSQAEIDTWLAEDQEVLRTGKTIEYVQEIIRDTGEVVYFHNVKKLLRLADGTPCILAMYTEITEQRRTESELRRAQDTAAELGGIRKATVTYAHEINNPLTGILANVQMMLEGQEMGTAEYPAESVEMLRDINTAALRIRDVILRMEALRNAKTKSYMNRPELIDLSDED